MRLSRASISAAILFALAAGSLPIACNVFVEVGRCATDGDCSPGFTCDRQGLVCVGGPPSSVEAGSDAPNDAPNDAPGEADGPTVPPCQLDRPFGEPLLVRGFEDQSLTSARFSEDERAVFYSKFAEDCSNPNRELCSAIYYAERNSTAEPFPPVDPHFIDAPDVSDYMPTLSGDGRLLLFESARSKERINGSYVQDQSRIWTTTKDGNGSFRTPTIEGTFGDTLVGVIEGAPYLLPRPFNGRVKVYFMSNGRTGGKGQLDIFVTELTAINTPQGMENISAVNTAGFEGHPVISSDDRVLYFTREDVQTRRHIRVSQRIGPEAGAFSEDAGYLPGIDGEDSGTDQFPTWVSPDHCRFYFISNRLLADAGADATPPAAGVGPYRLWVIERPK